MGTDEQRPEARQTQENDIPATFFVAGVGASAGGLEALTQLVAALPAQPNCCFVVLQHLSPNYRSMLVQLIGRETSLEVVPAEDGLRLRPGCVFVAPPRWDLILDGEQLRLVEPLPDIAPKPSVNRFLNSLASEYGEYAIGVILSGTGTDGSAGIRAVKASGGLTFAQEPNSAKYAGMPRAAIETVSVDFVLSPAGIAREVSQYVQRAPQIRVPEKADETDAERYRRLIKRVYEHTKVDFSGYKDSTVWRRIQRRMATTRCSDVDGYLLYTEKNPQELDALCKDILISVTGFFRDKAAFNSLKYRLNDVITNKQFGDEIRIWVAGCATGEEAYSIAILLADALGDTVDQYQIQIFATDIDMEALNLARRGTYSHAALEETPVHYVENYFQPNADQLEIVREIREMVVFARQDLVLDPPFLRLDLISCRNVLIYFTQELQAKVLSVMRYGLAESGCLFLGRSENISQAEDYFEPLDTKNRIFKAKPKVAGRPASQAVKARLGVLATQPSRKKRPTTLSLANEIAAAAYIPPSVLINSHFTILQTIGDIHNFVHFPDGVPQLDLSAMLGKELRSELLTLIHYARSKQKVGRGYPRRLSPGPKGLVRLAVHPYHPREGDERFLISFEIATRRRSAKKRASGEAAHDKGVLEDELIATQEHLQTVIEELETSNEEMQALNEEIQAANEELQASNEELEASNEELQSSNEELVTLNEELMIKSADLIKLNAEFENVQNNIDFPIIVLNADLVISRFNKAAHDILKLGASSLTKPIANLKLSVPFNELPAIAERTLSDQEPIVRPLSRQDRYFLLHAVPFESDNGATSGVIMALLDQTEVRLAERHSAENEERLLALMNNSPSIISVKDISGRYTFVNQRFVEFYGFEIAGVLGHTDQQVFPAHVATQLRSNDLEVLNVQKATQTEEQFEGGECTRYLESTRFPIFDTQGAITSVCVQSNDVTEAVASRSQLLLAASVFDHAGEGIVVTDAEGVIVSVNNAFERITGFQVADVIGSKPSILRSGRHSQAFYKDMWQHLINDGTWQGEIWNRRPNDEIFPEWVTITAVKDHAGDTTHYVGIFTDITQIKAKESHIEHLATHDDLTGLPNRALFTDRLRHALARGERSGLQCYVLFIDLDNFKVINDNLGHSTGDELLREAAKRIMACLRDQDTVARWGGDEFVVVLEEIDAERVTMIAKRIIEDLAESYSILGKRVFVTASVGISCYPIDGADVEDLLRSADTAMYKSKDSGKNQLHYFSEDLRLIVERRLELENGIRTGLEEDEFSMVYQPEVELATGRCVALEALMRWESKTLGMVSPVSFIPIAEESGLIAELTQWCLRSVMATIRSLAKKGLEPPPVFINMSSNLLASETLQPMLETQLAVHGIDASMIGIEITETALISDSEQVVGNLDYLRRKNIEVYVDDFGTGYSSLSFLKRYPIDGLKVDRSFVDGVVTQADDQALTSAVISIAHALGITVLAEGVETEQQRDALIARNCHMAQGYLFSRPLSVAKLCDYLADARAQR